MAAKKIKMVLTCPVCYELYKKPKYLPCYHSYCEECLVKLQVGSSITCPECRKTSVAPSGGVKDLPNNFFINRIVDEMALKEKLEGDEDVKCDNCIRNDPGIVLCVDCGVFLCNHCHESHKYSREYQGHHMMMLKEIRSEKKDVNVRPKPKPMLCAEHDMELNLYCETCEQLVCQYCTIREHRLEDGHDHNTVKKMANKQRAELDKIMEPVEKMIDGLAKAHKKVSSTRDRIRSQASEVEQQIDVYYEQLQRRLQQQREDLKKELCEVSAQKKKAVSLQLEQMEYTQAQLESVKELSEFAVKSGSDQEALFVKKQVTEDVKRLTDDYNKLDTESVESTNMTFHELEHSLPQFSMVYYGDASHAHSDITGIPSHIPVGKECKVIIITKSANGVPCTKGASKVFMQVQPRTGDVITVPIKDNQDGSYTASFLANQTGEVKLLITINGKHIKGSPYSVQTRQYSAINKPSKIVNDGGRMGHLWGIAFGKDGVWAVVDHSNHCVCIFDSQDQLVRRFGSKGNENGRLSSPEGLAFDDNNHLYVADINNNRVQKFDINGGYLLEFGKGGSGDGDLSSPDGIAVYNDKVFVVEYSNNRISVFQCDGQFIHTIGSGQLSRPYDVAVTDNNQVLVADFGNHCISIFTLDGNYVGKIGTPGSNRGQLSSPTSLTVDLCGFIMVTEYGNNRVSIFDKDGVFIHCFGSSGSNTGQFSSPYGIACSPNGSVYISDCGNKRIQIFSNY